MHLVNMKNVEQVLTQAKYDSIGRAGISDFGVILAFVLKLWHWNDFRDSSCPWLDSREIRVFFLSVEKRQTSE